MTVRYILLVFVSLSVFTVFAFAREAAAPSQNSYGDVESKKESIKESYFNERDTLKKAEEVATDPFDDFAATEFHGQTREQARIPSDPKTAAAQGAIVNELKSIKVLNTEANVSHKLYEDRSMNEAVEEQKEEEGAYIEKPFDPKSWQKAQQNAAILFAP